MERLYRDFDPGQSADVACDAGAVAMQKLSKQEAQLAEATSTSKVFEFFRFCLVFLLCFRGVRFPHRQWRLVGFLRGWGVWALPLGCLRLGPVSTRIPSVTDFQSTWPCGRPG